ncbi:MAG TPA: hypothetical protein VGW09_02400 [Nitrososphaeraceae archaeon]|nr:hypothetical protein [Nitrososphaeraceae archaeon]
MASISFSPDKMEFLILFTSGDISEDKQKETLNLGQAQVPVGLGPFICTGSVLLSFLAFLWTFR